MPPLLHPRARDDDFMEANFGELHLYILGDDEYDNKRHENQIPVREIVEDTRIDPATLPQKKIPMYDDEVPHARQRNPKMVTEEEEYESDYYWYYAMDDDVKRNPYNG